MPFGILVVRDDFIITISNRKYAFINDFSNNKIKEFYTSKKSRFIIQLLYRISSEYLKTLTILNKKIDEYEKLFYKA